MIKDLVYYDIENYKPINPQELLDKYSILRIQNGLYLKAVKLLEEKGCWPAYKLELFPLLNDRVSSTEPNLIIKYSLLFDETKNTEQAREAFDKIVFDLYCETFGVRDKNADFSLSISPAILSSKN